MRRWAMVLGLGLSATAGAQEDDTPSRSAEYGLETEVSSRYLFRGVPFSREPVSQTTMWVSFSGITLYAWGNVLLQREPGQNDFNELDFGASYSYERGRLTLEPAIDAYVFRVPAPRKAPHTTEGSMRASLAWGPALFFTRHTVDFVAAPGAYYAEAGLSFARTLSRSASLEGVGTVAWASARFNAGHIGVARGAWNHLGLELSLTWSPSESFYLRPRFELASFKASPLGAHLDEPRVTSFGIVLGFLR